MKTVAHEPGQVIGPLLLIWFDLRARLFCALEPEEGDFSELNYSLAQKTLSEMRVISKLAFEYVRAEEGWE